MEGVDRVDLGVFKTPVEVHRIAGVNVHVKRDDMIGGNKVRTLEYVLANPPASGHLLTYSTLNAHHAYATAVQGAKLGLETTAVILRQGQRGRCLEALNEVCGGGYVEVDSYFGAMIATMRLRKKGTRIIPPGGMSPRGALGYMQAALELDEVPSRLYVPLGTGTTVSGLLAGLMARGAETEVVGVRVAGVTTAWKWVLWRRAWKALKLAGTNGKGSGVTLRVVKAEGDYGVATEASKAAVAAAGDLQLESTYTGKTLAVLLAEKADGAMLLNTYAPVA